MLKNSRILLTLATMALVLCMAAESFALQTQSRRSQGNNYGLELNLGNSIFTGTSEYPRGSGNEIPTYEGCWGHFLSVARDLDGDGLAEDTLFGRSRGRTVYGRRGSLEAMDLLLEGFNAGHRMEQWAERVENNEVWSSLDPDNLARWPAEFRQGHTMSGAPVIHGAETVCAMHTDAWNRSYHRSVPPTGVSLEYQFYFLDFGESNDLAFGHLFMRNMSEYLKYNDNQSFRDQVAATPDGQVWGSFALMYVENYFGIGHDAMRPDEGWAYHPARVIKCMVDQNGLEDGFTNGGMAFMIGYTPLKNMEFNGETTYLSNTTNFRWSADFGISKALDIGTLSDPGQVHRWATCLQPDGTERDISDFYGDETSPYTGRALTGNPGVILPSDTRYNQWLWGNTARINYHAWSGLHDFGPRDTTSTDFAIMAAYPTNPPMVLKPNDIANIDDPDIQVQLAPFERMQDVAISVYGGGYVLPETPVPPALTIVPGDRQVTITWSNVNLNTPDDYYYFIQENPEVDPEGVYREYDFEGYRLYRSFVGPSDAHGELIWQSSLGEGNLAFSYVDNRQDDDPYYRMRNGMKIWYALVPFDRNYDPASGDELSLPALDQSKVWNRTFPDGYHTVRPRSNASNYEAPSLAGEPVFLAVGTTEALTVSSVELSGDGNGNLLEAPKYMEPPVEFTLNTILAEKITQQMTVNVLCTGAMPWNIKDPGCSNYGTADRVLQLVSTDGTVHDQPGGIPIRDYAAGYAKIEEASVMFNGPMSADGITYAMEAKFSGLWNGDLNNTAEVGSYDGGDVAAFGGRCWGGIGTSPGNQGYSRSGRFVLSWQDAGGGELSLSVYDETRGVNIPYSPYTNTGGWGFMEAGTEMDFYGEDKNSVPHADRVNLMLDKLPAGNTDNFTIYLNGLPWGVKRDGGVSMPAAGTTWTLTTFFGSWNDEKTVFTQLPDPPYPGDKWQISIDPMNMDLANTDLSKIRVVPNPYIASSMLDQSGGSRRIDFINLPSRCTVRIYSLGGNLVNVLNHIGASRTGWGNYTDLDNIQPDNSPMEFTGYDNFSGTEPWNMKNRFGQTVASGLYFYHVTDERGETHTGKFYIVN